MLVIRDSQIDILGKHVLGNFEERMVNILFDNYPGECHQAGGRDQIHKFVRQGIKSSEDQGYTTEKQAGLFISLMFILGSNFINDPQLSWISEYLDENIVSDPTMRLTNLFDETLNYLGEIAGEDCEFFLQALLRIRAFEFSTLPDTKEEEWIHSLLIILKNIYPQKFAVQGNESTRAMIIEGLEQAKHYGLVSNHGICAFILMMYILGSGFDQDLLYPWAKFILNDATITNEPDRVQSLLKSALEHLEQSLNFQ